MPVIVAEEDEHEVLGNDDMLHQRQANKGDAAVTKKAGDEYEDHLNDSTKANKRGGGILASQSDIAIAPVEFAEGCKLLQACALGNMQRVEAMLRVNLGHVNFRDYDRRTALHVAASEGHLNVVRLLVSKGAKINRSDRWGGSALDDALRHRHRDVAAYLRGKGGATGSADQTTSLITAAAQGDLEEVRMLLAPISGNLGSSSSFLGIGNSSGRRNSITHSSGKSSKNLSTSKSFSVKSFSFAKLPLSASSTRKAADREAAEAEALIDVNKGDYDQRTPLHLAAGEGHVEIVRLLCKRGADVNAKDRWGGRPLDDARRRNFTEVADILIEYRARPGIDSEHVAEKPLLEEEGKDGASTGGIDPNLVVDFSELEMIDRIGAGAFGEIYKCRWRGILVAAKCIKSTKILDEWHKKEKNRDTLGQSTGTSFGSDELNEALADFRVETNILRKLRHPNIAMLLAYSVTENFEVMVSELMKCSLLDIFKANLVNGTTLPKRQQIIYAQQLAAGMNYLHTCKPPIIHRDLKPANLLIDFSGVLKVGDFGLAKVRPDPTKCEEQAFVMTGETGSYRFMAPEVFRHEPYTENVDVYSFSMIFYYLLTGRPPWPTDNGLKAVTKAAVDGERPTIHRDWDNRISVLLQSGWDENPSARPNFQKIMEELKEYSTDVFHVNANDGAWEGGESNKCCAMM